METANKPLMISIVTASFNQGPYIRQAIQSVLDQGAGHVEHLIVDNCSSDDTPAILKEYPSLKLIVEPDKGQSDALNKGFKAASGDIVGWLNADDYYLPGCFEAVRGFFRDHPECDVLYGDYRLIDGAGKFLSAKKELGFDLFMLKYLHVLCIPSTATFFRRRVFEEGNFLKVEYHYSMDYEFFLRLALHGYTFAHLPCYLADFRVHADSKSQRQMVLQKQEMEKALLEQDSFLRDTAAPFRRLMRGFLMLAARFKRVGLKFISGAYKQ